jgi:hypothetical protein
MIFLVREAYSLHCAVGREVSPQAGLTPVAALAFGLKN